MVCDNRCIVRRRFCAAFAGLVSFWGSTKAIAQEPLGDATPDAASGVSVFSTGSGGFADSPWLAVLIPWAMALGLVLGMAALLVISLIGFYRFFADARSKLPLNVDAWVISYLIWTLLPIPSILVLAFGFEWGVLEAILTVGAAWIAILMVGAWLYAKLALAKPAVELSSK